MLRTYAPLLLIAAGCSGGSTVAANGLVDPWQTAAPLPIARGNHCSAVIDDTVFVIGGNRKIGDSFIKTDEIHAGRVAADGTITWSLAGKLPSPVSECTATADADARRLYVLDGLYDDDTQNRAVFFADFDKSGVLSAVTPFGTLPQIAISSEAAVRNGALLMMDTVLPADGDKTVTLRTPVDAPSWSTDDWSIGFRAQAQYAFGDQFAYTLGGYLGTTGNPVSADVFVAPIGKDGTVGAGRPTTALPAPTAFGEAVVVDDFVFVVGGRTQVFGAPASTTVYAAPIQTDGSLGAWQPVSTLPMGRTNHELAVVGDYLVIAGGAAMGPSDANVFTARVRFPD